MRLSSSTRPKIKYNASKELYYIADCSCVCLARDLSKRAKEAP